MHEATLDAKAIAFEPPTVRSSGDRRSVSLASLAILILGLALRVLSARGDLWIDEIWTLNLLTTIRSPGEVFWNISHDNNHFLNSLWMYIVGLDGSPLLFRLPSVIIGTLSIAVAGRIGARSGAAAGIIAAFIFAVGFPFVNYGSEARGYAGLILALLVAIDALDRALPLLHDHRSQPEFNRQRWTLGLAVGGGALCHLTMVAGTGILALGLICHLVCARSRPRLATMMKDLTRLFLPAALLVLPAVGAVAAGILIKGHMTVGGTSYAPSRFLTGYGGMADATLGFTANGPAWLSILVAGAGLTSAWQVKLLSGVRGWTALIGLGLVPGTIALANPPNTDYPRYFLVCGILLALTLAEAAGRALGARRSVWLVSALLLLFAGGQTALNVRLLVYGRGNVSEMVAMMASGPSATYAAPFSTAFQLAINYHSYRRNFSIERIALPLTCETKPDWYIVDASPDTGLAPETLELGPENCRITFDEAMDLPTSSLSGRHWTLFKRR